MSDGSSDSDDANNPTEKKLIEQYEKYPEYLKISFKKPSNFLDYLEPFNSSNMYSINSILSKKSREQLSEQSFPVTLYIQLVPELNILTISVANEDEFVTTDALFGDLLGQTDQGAQIMIDEIAKIVAMSQERLYIWLHTLAGLSLDFQNAPIQLAMG